MRMELSPLTQHFFQLVSYIVHRLYLCLYCVGISTVVDCGSLTNPDNGMVDTSMTTEGSTATYTCNTGYNISPGDTRTCQANGTWSGSEPTCDRKFKYVITQICF